MTRTRLNELKAHRYALEQMRDSLYASRLMEEAQRDGVPRKSTLYRHIDITVKSLQGSLYGIEDVIDKMDKAIEYAVVVNEDNV